MITPASARARSFLVCLALADGRSVSVTRLTEDLWSDDALPQDPRASIQTIVSRLRSITGPELIELTPSGYRLQGNTDLEQAANALNLARSSLDTNPEESVVLVDSALSLWRGEPGADLLSEVQHDLQQRAANLRTQLDDLLLSALTTVLAWPRVTALSSARLAKNPVDELAAEAFFKACVANGNVNEGLRLYAALREALAEELGTSPSDAIQKLYANLLHLDTLSATPPPDDEVVSSSHRGTHLGLRKPATELIGRDEAVADIRLAMQASRMVTVLGPGGLGKTRIAHEVGWQSLAAGAPLVVVVELAVIGSGEDVMNAVAAALGVHEATAEVRIGDRSRLDLKSQIQERLAAPGTVLIMDNCEHVIDGAAIAISELLETTQAHILATSRAPLEVAGEITFALPALGNGLAGDGPAVELFIQRALAVRSDAVLDRTAIAQLCTRLDGLPLAIELAAVRVRSMTLDEIALGLERRFALLTGGARSSPERHRTLRAVIEWSWEMLERSQQEILRQMSIYPAGFDSSAARYSTATRETPNPVFDEKIRDGIGVLVTQSLLVMTEDPDTKTSRFHMLETVREFALLELIAAGELEAARAAMSQWAQECATDAVANLFGSRQADVVSRIATEQDNLVQALRRAVAEGDGTRAFAIFGALGLVAAIRGTAFEILGLIDDLVPLERSARVDEARDAILIGMLCAEFGRVFVTRKFSPVVGRLQVLARRPDFVGKGWGTALNLGLQGLRIPDIGTAMQQARDSEIPVLVLLGYIGGAAFAENKGALEDALRLGEQGHRLAAEQSNLWAGTFAAQILGVIANERGDFSVAAAYFAEAHRHMQTLGAASDLQQIEMTELGNNLVGADLTRAEALYLRATATADSTIGTSGERSDSMMGAVELRAAGFAGLGEVAWLRGKAALAIKNYDCCLAEFASPGARHRDPSPMIHASAQLSIACFDALVVADPKALPARSDVERRSMAKKLRIRTNATLKMPHNTDFPVLGATVLGLGAAMWSDPRGDVDVDPGLELLSLAGRLGSRQVVPSLRREEHLARATLLWGDARIAAATQRVNLLEDRDVLARTRELLDPRVRERRV